MGKFVLIIVTAVSILLASIPHIMWLLAFIIAKCFGGTVRYAPFGWTAVGLVLAVFIILGYGYYVGRWRLEEKETVYSNPDIPAAFDGLRIVHISDLHLSTFYDNPGKLAEIVDRINDKKPDIVCFTGDLVTIGVAEADRYTSVLQSISAKYGVYSVLGNHDFLIYGWKSDKRAEEVERLVKFERDTLGWNLLRNSSSKITSSDSSYITIIGVDNKTCKEQFFHSTDTGDLKMAMDGTDGFRILLTHDPSHWDAEVVNKTDIQLTLSGHTHAAQMMIFGWTPASWFFKRTHGRYVVGNQTLLISTGIGCTAPIRLGVGPEITTIILSSK